MAGRPKKDVSEKKNSYVRVMLTDDEEKMLDFCCNHYKYSKSAVILAGLRMVYEDIIKKNEDR